MWWKSPYGYSKLCNINTQKKLIHCMAILTILFGNYYPPHGEFELICIGKFAIWTWVNFTQQYEKNRQRCQQNTFTMLYGNYCYTLIQNFPRKFSPCTMCVWVITTGCVAQHSRNLFINKRRCRSTGINLGMNPKSYRQYLTFEQVYRLIEFFNIV